MSKEVMVVFRERLTERKLLEITAKDSDKEEIENTKGLLAYEQGIDENDIEVSFK